MRAAGWLVLLSGLIACGGRYERRPDTTAPDTPPVPSASSPRPVLGEPGSPPFAIPAWVDFRWSSRAEEATTICAEHWSPEQARAALEQHNLAVYGGRLVSSEELLDLLALPQFPSAERLLHLFKLPMGETGAIFVKADGHDTLFYYLRIDATCQVHLVSSYARPPGEVSCNEPAQGFRMWRVPGPRYSSHICDDVSISGYYVFQAQVLLDSCGLTPSRFVGIFGFNETMPSFGSLWFADLAGHPATQLGFELYFAESEASTTRGDSGECTRRFTELWLRAGERLELSDERVICDDAGERTCAWHIEGTQIFGPL